jgi:hypothetical protein
VSDSQSAGNPMATARRDGTEILARDADGHFAIAAWVDAGVSIGSTVTDEPAWLRRADGDWDLFDGFGTRYVEPVEWWPLPV